MRVLGCLSLGLDETMTRASFLAHCCSTQASRGANHPTTNWTEAGGQNPAAVSPPRRCGAVRLCCIATPSLEACSRLCAGWPSLALVVEPAYSCCEDEWLAAAWRP